MCCSRRSTRSRKTGRCGITGRMGWPCSARPTQIDLVPGRGRMVTDVPIGDIDPQVRAAKAYEWALGEPTTWQGDDATQAVVDEDIDHFFRTVDQAVVTYHSQRLACRCCSLRCPNTITAFAPSAATLRSPTSRSTCIPTRCRSMRCANTHGTRCARATCSASRVCPTRIGTSARSGNRRPSRAAEAAIEGRVATLMLEAERMPSSTGLAAM